MMRRQCWAVAVGAASSILLAACGGGSGEAGCTHAAVPASGPGDVGHYFPVDVGRTWTYAWRDRSSEGIESVTVGEPATVQGEVVSVFARTLTIGAGTRSGADGYVVRPAGVYRVSRTDAVAPVDQALPLLVLPFPVQPASPTPQVTCRNLRFVEEGVTVDADIAVSVGILVVVPSLQVQAGTFADVAQVQSTIEITARAKGSAVTVVIYLTDSFAPGVGLISEFSMPTIGGFMTGDNESLELTSYAPVSTAGAPAGLRTFLVTADRSEPPARSPEALALRVARQIVRIIR